MADGGQTGLPLFCCTSVELYQAGILRTVVYGHGNKSLIDENNKQTNTGIKRKKQHKNNKTGQRECDKKRLSGDGLKCIFPEIV